MGGALDPGVKRERGATPRPFGKSGGSCYMLASILKISCPRTAP